MKRKNRNVAAERSSAYKSESRVGSQESVVAAERIRQNSGWTARRQDGWTDGKDKG